MLTSFGRCFGMLFQLRDDILDVIATDEELGKPAGQDLAEGIYTLPVLYALADPIAGPELAPLLGQPLGQPERDKARSIVAESGAIGAAGGGPPLCRAGGRGSVVGIAHAGWRFRQPGPLPGRRPSGPLTRLGCARRWATYDDQRRTTIRDV